MLLLLMIKMGLIRMMTKMTAMNSEACSCCRRSSGRGAAACRCDSCVLHTDALRIALVVTLRASNSSGSVVLTVHYQYLFCMATKSVTAGQQRRS